MPMTTLTIDTRERCQMLDITAQVAQALATSGLTDGAVLVFVPHTTAGVTINENADPDVKTDMQTILQRLAPRDNGYRHAEGNADSHLKTSLMGPSVLAPVSAGRLMLGVWQGIMLCEFDGPRRRKVYVQFLAGAV